MKCFKSFSFVLAAGFFGSIACTHNASDTSTEAAPSSVDTSVSATSQPDAKEGWEDVKDGTKQAASGVGEAAKAGGNKVVEGTKEVGSDIKEGAKDVAHSVKATACPVLGHKTTKVYYVKDHAKYKSMLSGKSAIASDLRECFASEANAREAGFKSSAK